MLYEVARTLLRLLAPVMSFTAEEAWQYLPGKKAESVFLAGPAGGGGEAGASRSWRSGYEKLFAVRGAGAGPAGGGAAGQADRRVAGGAVVLCATGEARELPGGEPGGAARRCFIVSQVELADEAGEKAQALASPRFGAERRDAEVLAAEGEKCPRCWTYSTRVGKEAELCARCEEALGG